VSDWWNREIEINVDERGEGDEETKQNKTQSENESGKREETVKLEDGTAQKRERNKQNGNLGDFISHVGSKTFKCRVFEKISTLLWK
jgi:hypothetical protein